MTRLEHLQWAKDRALKYCDAGDLSGAYVSLISDLNKHPETANHPVGTLGMALLAGAHLNTADKMREFIEGFN